MLMVDVEPAYYLIVCSFILLMLKAVFVCEKRHEDDVANNKNAWRAEFVHVNTSIASTTQR
ncbi:hypothetical protein BDZ85DRAFT_257130 [Elsinoe ampelina]|uniref:Uncharacterized protein n=1 Tax=Elsinoe ampelina TaxID=302913 RepID=A0A6A6GNG2_9PEZI|nr:hypothetical protein BDZ85DRAFT_257130 [Elsinoe ampelina]